MAKSTFFERSAASTLKRLARGFPIVGITGPSLFSWLQGLVDDVRKLGQFILTEAGS